MSMLWYYRQSFEVMEPPTTLVKTVNGVGLYSSYSIRRGNGWPTLVDCEREFVQQMADSVG